MTILSCLSCLSWYKVEDANQTMVGLSRGIEDNDNANNVMFVWWRADLLRQHRDLPGSILLNVERPCFQVQETSKQHVQLGIFVVFSIVLQLKYTWAKIRRTRRPFWILKLRLHAFQWRNASYLVTQSIPAKAMKRKKQRQGAPMIRMSLSLNVTIHKIHSWDPKWFEFLVNIWRSNFNVKEFQTTLSWTDLQPAWRQPLSTIPLKPGIASCQSKKASWLLWFQPTFCCFIFEI